jgi:hypothetical protein
MSKDSFSFAKVPHTAIKHECKENDVCAPQRQAAAHEQRNEERSR